MRGQPVAKAAAGDRLGRHLTGPTLQEKLDYDDNRLLASTVGMVGYGATRAEEAMYYVPKFADPHNLMTFDPALNFDWESDKRFFSLQVTAGRVIGKAFGGNAILLIKPSVFVGGDRPGSLGLEVGCKVLGF